MDPIDVWGDLNVNVFFNAQLNCYQYSCSWGCVDYDFDTYAEAAMQLQVHDCTGIRDPL